MENENELIKKLYMDFNARHIDAVLAMLTADVIWANAMDGGHVRGHDGIRAYWTRQWSMVDPHVVPVSYEKLDDGAVVVDVVQTVRDLEGNILQGQAHGLKDKTVAHIFRFRGGLVARFDVRDDARSRGHHAIWKWMRGLLWTGAWLAVVFGVSNVAELIYFDFVHGNPHRPESNAVVMMFLYAPLAALIAMSGVLIVFSASQVLLAGIMTKVRHHARRIVWMVLLVALPAAAMLSWFCFDYLTPSNLSLGGDDRPVSAYYQHGLTEGRFAYMLAMQAIVWSASYVWLAAAGQRQLRRGLLAGGLMLAIGAGVWWGHHLAIGQIKFL